MLVIDLTCLTQHDDYEPGCVNISLMSEVTKALTQKDPVPQAGWLMFGNTVCNYFKTSRTISSHNKKINTNFLFPHTKMVHYAFG